MLGRLYFLALQVSFLVINPLKGADAGTRGFTAVGSATAAQGCRPSRCFNVCSAPGTCRWVPFYIGQQSTWDCGQIPCKLNVKRTQGSSARNARAARARTVNEASVVMYNTMFSSQGMEPRYQFTGKHFLYEQAQRLIENGATIMKFDLSIIKRDGKHDPVYLNKGWINMLQSPEFPYLKVMDMPFKVFQMWAGELPGPGKSMLYSDIHGIDVYKEMYKLAVFILKRYKNTGKIFMIGHWEGDWAIRNSFNRNSSPDPKRVAAMKKLLSDKQRAIDEAKRDNAVTGVELWHYAEANLVELSRAKGPGYVSMINTIIPSVRPVIDFVSISAGGMSFTKFPDPSPDLHASLGYAQSKLPGKGGISNPRVLVGEYRFMLRSTTDAISGDTPTPELQKQKALWAAASAIAWGSRYVLWWAVFETETTRSGGYRGFWLVDNNNRETPLFRSMQTFWKDARNLVRAVTAERGRPPTDYEFRSWAVKRLVELSGTSYKKLPPIKTW